ncbi:two-component system response regulator EvgA [Serratia sp. PL17]|jgi:two-component system response regulator EvgA|uniref:response regulator n=1 Tax=Serratia sp. PL17 TaxID=2806582 RepID=UPI001AE5DFD5|nr:response regulator [Serratia sp. PL17]MBP1133075.1 two-component system response regulator EvgA [Serratia sp. PL17]
MKDVLIVDDHPVVRLAVRLLLEKDKMVVCGETDDGLEALALTRKLSPGLIIVDIDMPSLNGIDLVQRLRNNGYTGGILVLSGKDLEHYVKRCISVGADGFISKRNNLTELHDAVRAIKGGYGYFPLNRGRSGMAGNELSDQQKMASLSTKELQVLAFLARGVKVIEISQLMKISDKTVSTYKRRMMQKLEIHTMVELYEFTQRNNID